MTKNVHPEELLARAASGALSESERRVLELHLADCPGCRTQRLLEAEAALPLADADEGLLIRAENAALARYRRSRALAGPARGPGAAGVTRSDGSIARIDLRTQGGKPPH